MKRITVMIALVALASVGCSKIKSVDKLYDKVIAMDLTLEEQEMMLNKYVGKNAWTRTTLEDLKEQEIPGEPKKHIIPRDTKVEIVDINFAYRGALIMLDPKRRKIVYGLDIEPPLSVEKIEHRFGEILWFDSPMLRHVGYIRKWGKRAGRAVVNHEVFIGMPAAAALESWGIPTEIRKNEIGNKTEEQWAYRMGNRSKYIYVIDGKVSKWEE